VEDKDKNGGPISSSPGTFCTTEPLLLMAWNLIIYTLLDTSRIALQGRPTDKGEIDVNR